MIALNLVFAASIIGIIYRIKPFDNTNLWVSIVVAISLFLNSLDHIFIEKRKVKALEKIAVEISKSKSEEK